MIKSEAQKNGTQIVLKAKLQVGALTGFSAEVIRYYYEILKDEEPILRNSVLEAEQVPAILTCQSCHAVTTLTDYLLNCPACDSLDTVLEGGQDLYLESLEVEDAHEGNKNNP